jgi:hypothetical protein
MVKRLFTGKEKHARKAGFILIPISIIVVAFTIFIFIGQLSIDDIDIATYILYGIWTFPFILIIIGLSIRLARPKHWLIIDEEKRSVELYKNRKKSDTIPFEKIGPFILSYSVVTSQSFSDTVSVSRTYYQVRSKPLNVVIYESSSRVQTEREAKFLAQYFNVELLNNEGVRVSLT